MHLQIGMTLARVGIQAFSPKGEVFDPNQGQVQAHVGLGSVGLR